jgi:hypothetical protein
VLSYLYRISTIDVVANIVINSSFAPLLLKMAKRFKSSNLRALVVTLLGLLVRHATLVVPDRVTIFTGYVHIYMYMYAIWLDVLLNSGVELSFSSNYWYQFLTFSFKLILHIHRLMVTQMKTTMQVMWEASSVSCWSC